MASGRAALGFDPAADRPHARRGARMPLTLAASRVQVFLAAAADAGGDRARRPKTLYFDKMKAVKPNDAAADPALAKRLWEISETLTGATVDL